MQNAAVQRGLDETDDAVKRQRKGIAGARVYFHRNEENHPDRLC
jgi:hypothetical protein